jgi:hypothetical protein
MKIICLQENFPDWFLFLRKISAGAFVIFNKKLTLDGDHLLNRYIFEKKENLRNYTSVRYHSSSFQENIWAMGQYLYHVQQFLFFVTD